MRYFGTFLFLFLVVALAVSGLSAPAAPLSRILKSTGLAPEDFALLGAAERTLYETGTPQSGKVVTWANPETKSHGTVRLAALRGDCAYIQHMVYPRGKTEPIELRSRMCKAADGKWRLTP
jgi:surface antigen